jgi:L-gulonate 3-dehydrogenase
MHAAIQLVLTYFRGLVGRGWAMLFAAYGFRVSLYNVNPARVQVALDDIKTQLENLSENGLLRGNLTVDEQMRLMSTANTLEECIESAIYVQASTTCLG